jgi:hypothetical protein
VAGSDGGNAQIGGNVTKKYGVRNKCSSEKIPVKLGGQSENHFSQ